MLVYGGVLHSQGDRVFPTDLFVLDIGDAFVRVNW